MTRDASLILRFARLGALALATATALAHAAALPEPALNAAKTGRAAVDLAPGWSPYFDGYRSAGGRHKVYVDAQMPAPAGAQTRVDYGAFRVGELSQPALDQLKPGTVDVRDHYNVVALRVGAIDTTLPAAQALRAGPSSGKSLHLIQFAGPIRPEWVEQIESAGVAIVTAIPHNAYLVYGAQPQLAALVSALRPQAHVQWDAPYAPEWRIDPALPFSGEGDVTIQLVDDASENATTRALLDSVKVPGAPVYETRVLNYVNLTTKIRAQGIDALAQRSEVVFVERFVEPRKHDEVANRIVTGNVLGNGPAGGSHLAWLATMGFTQGQFDGTGLVVDVTDSGLDNGTQTPNHFALYKLGTNANASRVVYNRLVGTPHAGSTIAGQDGHGTLNTHIVGGYVPDGAPFNSAVHTDADGFKYGLGVAPFVRFGSSVIFDPSTYTNPNIPSLISMAFADGARISTNSWGANTGGGYNANSQAYDALVRDAQSGTAGNQPMIVVFSAGNAGPNAQTLGAPGTAKNVITVGASEGVRAFGGADQCNILDTGADSFNDIIFFSSRGPTADGRKKPDLVALGTHITGGVWQQTYQDGSGAGVASATFDATGVCGGPPASPNFFPTGQQYTTASSGTSHSTPMVAGGAALIYQWWLSHVSVTPPSPAMVRAILMNSARYLTGASANDTLPSTAQGMGTMDLGKAFETLPRTFRDQLAPDLFTATGQIRSSSYLVADGTKPIRVTLTWTDPPGPTSGAAYINDLDLEVIVGGQRYRGNVFSGATSTTGGTADFRDNAESVFLPPMPAGTPFAIRVIATNIAGDGVPGNASALDQDFALLVTNANVASVPVLTVDAVAVTAESFSPANAFADPSETVNVDVTVRNNGAGPAVNVVGTPQTSATLLAVTAGQPYGTIGAGATATANHAVRSLAASCAAPISGPFAFTIDGAAAPSDTLSVGGSAPETSIFAQDFEAVSPPALPAGWTATVVTGAPSLAFQTVAAQGDGGSIAAKGNGANVVTDQNLESPSIPIPASASAARLQFRHYFNLEAGAGNTGFDGAVLELSVNAGPYQDILAAGGSFTSGGYNRTISGSFGSPIAGRQAWSGAQTSYVTVSVSLPPGVIGQSIRLRWRVASDSSVLSADGYRLDNVQILLPACENPLVSVSPASLSFAPTRVGQNSATQNVTVTNQTAGTVNLGHAITGTNTGSFSTASPLCGSLGASANCAASVRANPQTPHGNKSAQFTITATQGPKTQVYPVPLSVLALQPVSVLVPAATTLASPGVGLAGPQIGLALTNDGNTPMSISSISVGGPGFARMADTCPAAFPAILNPGSACTINVRYTAPNASPQVGSVTVISDGAGSPSVTTLTGTLVAGLTRSFVAPGGNDANPCSLSSPCRNLQAAIEATAAGGEVVVLETADYGPVSVTKPITIASAKGTFAGMSVTAGDGIAVGAPNVVVVLRNLTLNGNGGQNGVRVLNAAAGAVLHLENVSIANMAGSALEVNGPARVFVKESLFRSNVDAQIHVASAAGGASVTIDGSRIEHGGSHGVAVDGGIALVRRTVIAENAGDGARASSGLAPSDLVAEDATITRNDGNGVIVAGASATATVRRSAITSNLNAGVQLVSGRALVDRCTVHGNLWGLVNGGGTLETMGNNSVSGNNTDTFGSIIALPRS